MIATKANTGTLAIGVVADTVTQRQRLSSSLKELGLVTCFCGSPAQLYACATLPLAACWLVQLLQPSD